MIRFGIYIIYLIALLFTQNLMAIKEIKLIISVDWEGYSLEDHNIESFQKFRNDYPHIKIVHFLNAAYFLEPGWEMFSSFRNYQVRKKISSVIRQGDEFGLHIHATETLLNAAGVSFRESETFGGQEHSIKINGVRGHDVPLTLFSEEEIFKIIQTSIAVLNKNGFKDLTSFRAGGWAASPAVLNATLKSGISVDSSAVPPQAVKKVTGTDAPIYKNVVAKLWPNITYGNHKEFIIKTSFGDMIEVPNNFGLADYLTGEEVFREFINSMSILEDFRQRTLLLHFGFHQETATRYINRVRNLIDLISEFTYQKESKFILNSSTLQEFVSFRRNRTIISCHQLF